MCGVATINRIQIQCAEAQELSHPVRKRVSVVMRTELNVAGYLLNDTTNSSEQSSPLFQTILPRHRWKEFAFVMQYRSGLPHQEPLLDD